MGIGPPTPAKGPQSETKSRRIVFLSAFLLRFIKKNFRNAAQMQKELDSFPTPTKVPQFETKSRRNGLF